MIPPLIVKDREVGVDEGHSTMDSHVSPPPQIVEDGEVGVDEGHSIEQQHNTRSSINSKSLLPGPRSSKALCMYP